MNSEDIIEQLNELLRMNEDAETGFETAANDVKNSELETLFAGYARQHGKFAAELKQELERLGGTVGESGSVEGAIHRGWMSVKSAISGHSPAAILASCQSAEESAVVAYDNAAEATFTGQPRKLIEKQREQIRGFHMHLVRLRGETKDGVEFPENE